MRFMSPSSRVILGSPKLLHSQNVTILEMLDVVSICHVFPRDAGLLCAQYERLWDYYQCPEEVFKRLHFIAKTRAHAGIIWNTLCRFAKIHRKIQVAHIHGAYFVNRPMRARQGLLYADPDCPEDVDYLKYFSYGALYDVGESALFSTALLTPSGKASNLFEDGPVVVRRFATRRNGPRVVQETQRIDSH